MKSIAIVSPPERVNEEQLLSCFTAWGSLFNVSTISVRTDSTHPGSGVLIADHATLETTTPALFDAIVVLGGTGTQEALWDHEPLIVRLQQFDTQRKFVAGIGEGSMVLAQAGLLVGKVATTLNVPTLIAELENYGAIYSPEDIITVTWIVTASGHDVHRFAQSMTALLSDSATLPIQ
jgi:protease I